jgi:hypothetical protein
MREWGSRGKASSGRAYPAIVCAYILLANRRYDHVLYFHRDERLLLPSRSACAPYCMNSDGRWGACVYFSPISSGPTAIGQKVSVIKTTALFRMEPQAARLPSKANASSQCSEPGNCKFFSWQILKFEKNCSPHTSKPSCSLSSAVITLSHAIPVNLRTQSDFGCCLIYNLFQTLKK